VDDVLWERRGGALLGFPRCCDGIFKCGLSHDDARRGGHGDGDGDGDKTRASSSQAMIRDALVKCSRSKDVGSHVGIWKTNID
jgi:hypothetical protein